MAWLALGVLVPNPALAQLRDACATTCHQDLARLPFLHAAVKDAGCSSCHTQAVASDQPPKCKSGKVFATQQGNDLCAACHAEYKSEFRHAAIEAGCSECHDPHGGKDKYHLTELPQDKLCFKCHDAFASATSMHQPAFDGDCTDCHDPHETAQRPLLKKARPELCFDCHDRRDYVEASGSRLHLPVAEGKCSACHQSHASKVGKLLILPGAELCSACHGPKAQGPTASLRRLDLNKKHVHSALQQGLCSECHLPHRASSEHMLVSEDPTKLCGECHAPFAAKHKHSAVTLGRCARCHDPHASDHPNQLKAGGSELCFVCHADDVTGRVSVHTPVAKGQCLGCHQPHESASSSKLVTLGEGNTACMACHGGDGSAKSKINLGKKTVHAPIARFGCKACHDAHGSNHKLQLLAPINDMCSKCHPKQKDGSHIMSGFSGKPHPVNGDTPDPSRKGQTMSCTSCHDPHSASIANLLRGESGGMGFCGLCHNRMAVNKTPPAPAAPPATLPPDSPQVATEGNKP